MVARVNKARQGQNKSNKGQSKSGTKKGVKGNDRLFIGYLQAITKAAKVYRDNYCNKDITYTYINKDGMRDTLTITFMQQNFMHMCGILAYEGFYSGDFYEHALDGRLMKERFRIANVQHFVSKMKAIKNLKELMEQKDIGVVDNNVVYKRYDFGQMVRTKEDLISIGTVDDAKTRKKVPLTLINIPLATDTLKAAMSCFCPVVDITITPIHTN